MITKFELQNIDDLAQRRIVVTLSNKTKIYIRPLCFGLDFEQQGGTVAEREATLPIAEEYNEWLHGRNRIEY